MANVHCVVKLFVSRASCDAGGGEEAGGSGVKSAKLWVVLVLMVAAAVVLHARGDVDHVPASLPLAEVPSVIGGWNSVDIALDDQVKQVLGNGVFLNRVYAPPVGPDVARTMGDVSLGLFIGYFPTQRTGQSIHSPQNCLPGAGWIFEKAGVTKISNPGEKRRGCGRIRDLQRSFKGRGVVLVSVSWTRDRERL